MPLTKQLQEEFENRLIVYDTGIQRIARNILRKVVESYLARETMTVSILHSVKTLALEMWQAMAEGDWFNLGLLLDRHWELSKRLHPQITNSRVDAVLRLTKPYLSGAKLSGAGGGGFLILLAKDPDAADTIRRKLEDRSGLWTHDLRISTGGLSVKVK